MISAFVFYVLAFVLIGAATLVISARNPVHSVLFLILAFFNAAGLFLLIGAEYIAMTLVIVYVGAVAILFLFVVMMLDIDIVEMRQGFLRYLPVGLAVALLFITQLVLVIYASFTADAPRAAADSPMPPMDEVSNAEAIGNVLYTDYVYGFQVAGLILLVAMIGAIVLTLRHRKDVRRQNIARQNARTKAQSIELIDVRPGSGA